jgi:hypothetical protein
MNAKKVYSIPAILLVFDPKKIKFPLKKIGGADMCTDKNNSATFENNIKAQIGPKSSQQKHHDESRTLQ